MSTSNQEKFRQHSACLMASADLANAAGQATLAASGSCSAELSLADRLPGINAGKKLQASCSGCEQSLMLSFYFDGTGNNMVADAATRKLSNVAKLYMAHKINSKIDNIYVFYVPGIGTYSKEVGDVGGGTAGLAFGAAGEARIKRALERFKETVNFAEARAQNPRNKIVAINVAAFGFSRGATMARAFARELQKLCRQSGSDWTLKQGGYPVRFYFLGLWDTVASVGIPMSAGNTRMGQTMGLTSTASALQWRNTTAMGVRYLAFADISRGGAVSSSPGAADGHSSWADNIEIPAMVEKCIHMVAAHEIRNSFPLDSCRRGTSYPASTSEMVYPGAHSDVGGGYRPGEGARSPQPGQMLSLIPLRAMHKLALDHGVPLHPLNALPSDDVMEAFAVDDGSKDKFKHLNELWHHYMKQAESSGSNIGVLINAHMRLYYQWRFHKIRKNRQARAAGKPTTDQQALAPLESEWSKERKALEQELQQLEKEALDRQGDLEVARRRWLDVQTRSARFGTAVDPSLKEDFNKAKSRADAATDKYLKTRARYDTLPSSDGSLARNLEIYDDQLMADAEILHSEMKNVPGRRLRPHYRNLLDAYEAEFVRHAGLRDEKIIEFFDTCVHDSLAGFARDATLPSDPRVVYVGGDEKLRHAGVAPDEDKARAA